MSINTSLFILPIVAFSTICLGWEAPDTLWTVSYSIDVRDYSRAVLSTADGGFVIGGLSGHTSPEWYFESLLIKFDSTGAVLWQNTFSDTTIEYSEAMALVQTPDNGFLLAGSADYLGSNDADIRAIKTDSNGNAQWEARIGHSQDEFCNCMAQTSDGGYVFAGCIGIYPLLDMLLVKTDSLCNVEWSMNYGDSGDDQCHAVQQTMDGGYILCGESTSYDKDDFYIVKTDSNGNIEWEKSWGTSHGWESIIDVYQTSDGGYLLLGNGDYCDVAQLFRLDESGNIQWEKIFNGYKGFDFIMTDDGGCVITGRGHTPERLWLTRTDSSGNTIWETTVGGQLRTLGFSVCETLQGGYIVAGQASPSPGTYTDLYLACFESCTGISEDELLNSGLGLFPSSPNPFRNAVNTEYSLPVNSDVIITIYDTVGRIVSIEDLQYKLAGLHTYTWTPLESLPSGCYMIAIEACGERAVRRCVKLD